MSDYYERKNRRNAADIDAFLALCKRAAVAFYVIGGTLLIASCAALVWFADGSLRCCG